MKAPKLANCSNLDEFSHAIADALQEKASKENAGFIQIVRGTPTRNDIVVSTGVLNVSLIISEADDG